MISRAAHQHPEPAILRLPAPRVPLEHFLACAPSERTFLWASPDGDAVAGSGIAAEIVAHGASRFADIRDQGTALLRQFPGARLFGGFSFEPGRNWTAFPDAAFVLPRFLYAHDQNRAWLSVTLTEEASQQEWMDQAAEIQARLLSSPRSSSSSSFLPPPSPTPPPPPPPSPLPGLPWNDRVAHVLHAIRDGGLIKVVLAQAATLRGAFDPLSVISGLADEAHSFRFAFTRGDATFLGLTPERLIAKQGDRVRCDALAGTVGSGDSEDAATRLLASRKDHDEHARVVEGITSALLPLGVMLETPGSPAIRRLKHVLHLHTPIEGRATAHILDLAAALHPTPAVGGWPRSAALATLRELEPDPRGWYAAPVGWFDADGNGELAVAIRSAHLSPREARVWAGAGIVAASDASKEQDEIRLKQRGMFLALGVER